MHQNTKRPLAQGKGLAAPTNLVGCSRPVILTCAGPPRVADAPAEPVMARRPAVFGVVFSDYVPEVSTVKTSDPRHVHVWVVPTCSTWVRHIVVKLAQPWVSSSDNRLRVRFESTGIPGPMVVLIVAFLM